MDISSFSEEIAFTEIQSFFRVKPFIVFGTGMSCALDTKFGMLALRDHLLSEIPKSLVNDRQNEEWMQVNNALAVGTDLEHALDSVSDKDLIKTITNITADLNVATDQLYGDQILSGNVQWPGISLLKKILSSLTDNDPILSILTPNYDLLFEYACEYEKIRYTTGGTGNICRVIDWNSAHNAHSYVDKILVRGKYKRVAKTYKHIRLFKVHGSLSYFNYQGEVVENYCWMREPPPGAERVMITPGLSKYEKLQKYRTELLKAADEAIEKSSRFLFLGYGFNDGHLEVYIKRKLIEQGGYGLIITRGINSRIEDLLNKASNLLVLCSESSGTDKKTMIYNSKYKQPLIIHDKALWVIDEFVNHYL